MLTENKIFIMKGRSLRRNCWLWIAGEERLPESRGSPGHCHALAGSIEGLEGRTGVGGGRIWKATLPTGLLLTRMPDEASVSTKPGAGIKAGVTIMALLSEWLPW